MFLLSKYDVHIKVVEHDFNGRGECVCFMFFESRHENRFATVDGVDYEF